MKLFDPKEIVVLAMGLVLGWEEIRGGSSVPIFTPEDGGGKRWDIPGLTLDLAAKETGIKAIVFKPKGKIEVEF